MATGSSKPLLRAGKIAQEISGYKGTPQNIAAIDFGTTSVSLSYITEGDTSEPKIFDWGTSTKRVSNAILLKDESSLITVASFGNHACTQYERVRSRSKIHYMLFERIKMLMKRDKNIKRDLIVESLDGDKVYLVELIAFILKHVKERLIERLSHTVLKPNNFHWVITVPAIWDARGKRMMREAAYLAGLTSNEKGIQVFTPVGNPLKRPYEINPDKLLLALEPEVAAVYCQQVEPIQKADWSSSTKHQCYAVLDIGGGTVDITIQEKSSYGNIKVISSPEGNDWGGTKVNEQFSLLFQNIVKDPNFSRLLGSCRDEHKIHLDLNKLLYEEFESQKKLFGEGQQIENQMVINIPLSLVKFYGNEIEDSVNSMSNEISFDESIDTAGALILESSAIENLFQPAIDGIIECIQSTLDKIDRDVDTYYFVGGFGGCKYLYDKLVPILKKKQTATVKCQQVIPTSPELAVVCGAVMWRKSPHIITARRADATYGIEVAKPFDITQHNPIYSLQLDDQLRVCKNIFLVFVLKDEITKSNEVFRSDPIGPSSSSQYQMVVNILSSPNINVQYTKDEDGKDAVVKIGQIIAEIPPGDSDCRKIIVEMSFNQTEIMARVENSEGKEYKTCCDFLN